MQTNQQEKSVLLPPYISETSFGGRSTKYEEIERRIIALRNQTTGSLDTTKIGPHENLLSEED